jgi:hypothetical protein
LAEPSNLFLEVGKLDEALLQLDILLLVTFEINLQAFNLLGLLVEFLRIR